MEKKRFRHHFSCLFEQLFVVAGTVLLVVFTQMTEVIQGIVTGEYDNQSVGILGLVILGVILIVFVWRVRVWSKTWITIDSETITIERNTILHKKNTIGYQNISNVNIVQNLLEMILGTCKVKLDTNSLSTANKNDVAIVLKKEDGEELKRQLIQLMNAASEGQKLELKETIQPDEDIVYTIESSFKDIFFHGIYSINFLAVIIFLCGVGGFVFAIRETFVEGDYALGAGATWGTVVTLIIMVYSSFASLVKGFVSMYGFKSVRIGERLHLKYGLFKKVEYAIPVDKINGILIHQTMIARLFHKYTVELINVGMGDDEKESVNFIFYTTKEHLEESMKVLLPEFAEALEFKIEKQPSAFWTVKLIRILPTLLVLLGGGLAAFQIFPEIPYQSYYLLAVAAFIALLEMLHVLEYRTKGSQMGEHHLVLVDGMVGRKYVIMSYSKIQYVEYHENFITKRLGMGHGKINLLAAAKYKEQTIPYIKSENVEILKERMLAR